MTASVLASVALVLLATTRALPHNPIRAKYLDERWGQLIIIILGEGILLLGEVVLGRSSIPNPSAFVLMFMAMFGFWRLYFDSAMRVKITQTAPIFTALAAVHLVLIFGLMVSFDFFAQAVNLAPVYRSDVLIGAVAVGLAFAALASIVIVRRGMCAVAVVNAGFALGFVLAGVIGQATAVTVSSFITACLLIVVAYAGAVTLVDPSARRLTLSRPHRG